MPSLRLEVAAGLVAWAVAAAPALGDVMLGATEAAAWRYVVGAACWLAFGSLFVAIASGRLDHTSAETQRWVLLALSLLAAACTVLLPSYSVTGILLILVAVVAAHTLSEAWAVVWTVCATVWIGAVTALVAPPGTATLQALAYGSFMAFALLTTRAGIREARARAETARRAAELAATRRLLIEHERVSERLRIARDLHDLLGHRLTALVLNLDAAGRSEGTAAREAIGRAEALARSLLDAVREAVRTVRAEDALDVGDALRTLVRDVPTPEVILDVPDRIEIADARVAHALVSCAQEAITNAVRHARARRLWIEVRHDGDRVVFEARDDGAGASWTGSWPGAADASTAAQAREGSGLVGMRERLETLGGRLDVTPDARPGFRLRAELPARHPLAHAATT
jgi:signal transduction histidine kinase